MEPKAHPYIVQTSGTCSGRPRIDGTRVRVLDVAAWSERFGWTPDQIAREFELSLSQVHAALAYYFDHIEEIREDLRQEDKFAEELRKKNPSKLPSRA
ncbi:DUF433 domain-containing protein [bacterium CPR1]|nr:DUF433 domain-containing protein [bacterium CPR1]